MGEGMDCHRPVHRLRPDAVTLEIVSLLRSKIEREVSIREAHRTLKIWRALWRVGKNK